MSRLIAIGLGANIGTDSEIVARFRAVADALDELFDQPVSRSPVYRTAPLGPVRDQPPFLNAALVATDNLDIDPIVLMAALLDMEALAGRDRSASPTRGPRHLDLDLLLFGDESLAIGGPVNLIVPHPQLTQRAFALRPLEDLLGPTFQIPGANTLATHLKEIGDTQPIAKLAEF